MVTSNMQRRIGDGGGGDMEGGGRYRKKIEKEERFYHVCIGGIGKDNAR